MLRLSRAAIEDLRHIHVEGLERFGAVETDHYIQGLLATLDMLVEYPRIGVSRPELNALTRTHPYRSHLIFYRIDPTGDVRVQRIRHGREDWAADPVGEPQ